MKTFDYYVSRSNKVHRGDWIAQALSNDARLLCGANPRDMKGIEISRYGADAVLSGERPPFSACQKCFKGWDGGRR